MHLNFGTGPEREEVIHKTIARAQKAIKKIGDPKLLISRLSLCEMIVNRDELKMSMRQAAYAWLKEFIASALGSDKKEASEFIYKHHI
jgi:hypothetical protein